MIRYLRLRFFSSDGVIWEQWYKNLVPVPTITVPPSVVEKACCCGCDGGGFDVRDLKYFDDDTAAFAGGIGVGKMYISTGNTYADVAGNLRIVTNP